MIKLLRADFSRLFKNKVFYLFTAGIFVISAYCAFSNYGVLSLSPAKGQESITVYPLEMMPAVAFLIAVSTTFFVGTNFSSNTIRNKLFCGCSKTQIYLSNSIVSLFVSLVFSAAFSLSGIGVIKAGAFPTDIYFAVVSLGVVSAVAFSCISTFFSFVVRGRTVPMVVLIALFAGMFALTSTIGSVLGEPEYNLTVDKINGVPYDRVSVIPSDAEITYKNEPNLQYCGGTKRKILETVSNILPTSHMSILSNISVSSDKDGVWFTPQYSSDVELKKASDVYKYINAFYSIGFSVFITAAGVLIFKKEQLS